MGQFPISGMGSMSDIQVVTTTRVVPKGGLGAGGGGEVGVSRNVF